MVRKLPSDPVKKRNQHFKRIYQHLEHWQALMEDRGMPDVITAPDGEDIYIRDLLVGIDHLPPRQRQAFELICLGGFTETAARDILLPNSKSSTPVQQYADSGLIRMISAYDLKQMGQWPPEPVIKPIKRKSKPKKKITWRKFMEALQLHPLVKAGLEKTRNEAISNMEPLQAQLKVLQDSIADLQAALDQVDEILGAAPDPIVPAPNPVPEGKPSLQDMAKELVAAGGQ